MAGWRVGGWGGGERERARKKREREEGIEKEKESERERESEQERAKERGKYSFTHPNRATHHPLYTSLCTGELNAFRKRKCFLCSPFYVKGVSLGHVGRN